MSSSTSDFSDLSDNVMDVDEFLHDLNEILSENGNDSSSDDGVQRREIRRKNRERLWPFYQRRKDVLDYFDDEKLRRTFRFDRASIQFITGFNI